MVTAAAYGRAVFTNATLCTIWRSVSFASSAIGAGRIILRRIRKHWIFRMTPGTDFSAAVTQVNAVLAAPATHAIIRTVCTSSAIRTYVVRFTSTHTVKVTVNTRFFTTFADFHAIFAIAAFLAIVYVVI